MAGAADGEAHRAAAGGTTAVVVLTGVRPAARGITTDVVLRRDQTDLQDNLARQHSRGAGAAAATADGSSGSIRLLLQRDSGDRPALTSAATRTSRRNSKPDHHRSATSRHSVTCLLC